MMGRANAKDKKIRKTESCFLPLVSCLLLKKAQTAMELAVFGAILIFVVGLIVRQSLEAGYQQNQNFRAMRLAMKTSYEYSEGLAGDPVASRNRASVFVIEDRLTADSSKFGALDRTQQISAGSAAHSRTLNLPVDFGEVENLPVYDVFVNGKHFPFTVAGFKTVRLAESCQGADCSLHPECKNDCGGGSVQVYPGVDVAPGNWVDNCAQVTLTGQCWTFSATCLPDCTGAGCAAPAACTDCSDSSFETFEDTYFVGCARLFTKVYNYPTNASWCDHDGSPSANSCDPICPVGPAGCNLSADDRFNLDRTGGADVPLTERRYFSWQWSEVMGFDEEAPQGSGWTTLSTGEGINFSGRKNTSVDIDGDLKEETILPETFDWAPNSAVITRLGVLDDQDGDLDFTIGDNENKRPAGLTRDLKMYAFVLPGTYYTIEEGRLFDPADGQFIRNVSKKDQIDLVERVFQLSNNTGRFCSNGVRAASVDGLTNPVEACSDCFTSANIQATCLDEASLLLFMRSRVSDARGRKWITPTGGDDYVDFTLPAGP